MAHVAIHGLNRLEQDLNDAIGGDSALAPPGHALAASAALGAVLLRCMMPTLCTTPRTLQGLSAATWCSTHTRDKPCSTTLLRQAPAAHPPP